MKRALLLALFIAPCVSVALPPPLDPDIVNPDDPIPPKAVTFQARLSGMIGSHVNYYAYVPKLSSDLEIVNQDSRHSAFLFASVSNDGEYEMHTFELEPNARLVLPAEVFQSAQEAHLLSLLPFEAIPTQSIRLAGVESQTIKVRSPDIRLRMVQVATPDGGKRTMGVDNDGGVHFPVFAPESVFGLWSKEDGAVILEDGGTLFQIFEEK